MASATTIFKFTIRIDGPGGEFVIGTIPRSVRDYWAGISRTELALHLIDGHGQVDMRLDGTQIDAGFTTGDWYENDDIVHVDGIELSTDTSISLISDEAEDPIEFEKDSQEFKACLIYTKTKYRPIGKNYLIARTYDANDYLYHVESNEPFSLDKLKLEITHWNEHAVISAVSYDGTEIECDASGHRTDPPYLHIR